MSMVTFIHNVTEQVMSFSAEAAANFIKDVKDAEHWVVTKGKDLLDEVLGIDAAPDLPTIEPASPEPATPAPAVPAASADQTPPASVDAAPATQPEAENVNA